VEQLGVRAPTQCGFREAHGCLDAVFVLHHLINKARHQQKQLFFFLRERSYTWIQSLF
jgi:hypothetical protein